MQPLLRVLSDDDRASIHQRTLDLLGRTGVRVDTAGGRAVLAAAGAGVDESSRIVRLPRPLVESSLAAIPRQVVLGGRRPGWGLALDGRECALVADGEAMWTWDAVAGVRRPTTHDDWLTATNLLEAIDEVGVYWRMVEAGLPGPTAADAVHHWHSAYGQFSKHVQDSVTTPAEARWLLEMLQVVAGEAATVRASPPFSFLVCPHSPLVIEAGYTDAWLAAAPAGLPVAIMPMPMMGLTSPASLAATIVQGNAEVLAMACLVQAAAPGTPIIYAPALAVMEPRSGRYGGGAVEHGLLGAATTEMARFYGLPAEASAGGSDHHVPGLQAALEGALNWALPTLAWPDLLVGPGCLGGSMVFSPEQLVIDVDVFRRCRRLRAGIGPAGDERLDALLAEVTPGATFIASPATRDAVRAGEWQLAALGLHGTFEEWDAAGRPDLLDEARNRIATLLAGHQRLPLDEAAERELDRIEQAARADETAALTRMESRT